MKKKRTGVRPARKAPRAPTRVKKPKASEGARQSPFSTDWKYLDVGERTTPKAVTAEGGGKGKGRNSSPNAVAKGSTSSDAAPRALTYFEPPKIQKPFLQLTDEQILKWFDKQDASYQSAIVAGVIEWDKYWMAKGKPLGLTLRPGIAKYLRMMGRPHCSCGDAGYPNTFHTLDARKCFKRPPAELLYDEEDDDLPF